MYKCIMADYMFQRLGNDSEFQIAVSLYQTLLKIFVYILKEISIFLHHASSEMLFFLMASI